MVFSIKGETLTERKDFVKLDYPRDLDMRTTLTPLLNFSISQSLCIKNPVPHCPFVQSECNNIIDFRFNILSSSLLISAKARIVIFFRKLSQILISFRCILIFSHLMLHFERSRVFYFFYMFHVFALPVTHLR